MTHALRATPSRRRLHLGAVVPSVALAADPIALRDYAQAAEGLGYDYIAFRDHVLGASHAKRDPPMPPQPYDETHAFDEPFVTMGFLAAATTKIGFCTSVLVLPQRQTALVAKQAAQVQSLSSGRLRLGVAVGWNHVESLGLESDFHRRGRRIDEQIEVLRRLFDEDVVEFHGRFTRSTAPGSTRDHRYRYRSGSEARLLPHSIARSASATASSSTRTTKRCSATLRRSETGSRNTGVR